MAEDALCIASRPQRFIEMSEAVVVVKGSVECSLTLLGGCPRTCASEEAREGSLEITRIGPQEDIHWRGIHHLLLALNACGR